MGAGSCDAPGDPTPRADAALKRTLSATPNVELALRGVPTQPATLGLDTVRQDALSLVRQLKRRIQDLPALADRVEATGVAAAEEAARAQHGLAQPFKHADALNAATARSRTAGWGVDRR